MKIANWQLKKKNERKETEKNDLFFKKKSQLSNFEDKIDDLLNIFKFLEQFIIDNSFMKLTQFGKTGSMR